MALGLLVGEHEELVNVGLIPSIVLNSIAVRCAATPVAFDAEHPVLGEVHVFDCHALGLGAHIYGVHRRLGRQLALALRLI